MKHTVDPVQLADGELFSRQIHGAEVARHVENVLLGVLGADIPGAPVHHPRAQPQPHALALPDGVVPVITLLCCCRGGN